jgi:hypothetical protein
MDTLQVPEAFHGEKDGDVDVIYDVTLTHDATTAAELPFNVRLCLAAAADDGALEQWADGQSLGIYTTDTIPRGTVYSQNTGHRSVLAGIAFERK